MFLFCIILGLFSLIIGLHSLLTLSERGYDTEKLKILGLSLVVLFACCLVGEASMPSRKYHDERILKNENY